MILRARPFPSAGLKRTRPRAADVVLSVATLSLPFSVNLTFSPGRGFSFQDNVLLAPLPLTFAETEGRSRMSADSTRATVGDPAAVVSAQVPAGLWSAT